MAEKKILSFLFFILSLIVLGIVGCNSIMELITPSSGVLTPTTEKALKPTPTKQPVFIMRASNIDFDIGERILLLGNEFQVFNILPNNYSGTISLSSNKCELINVIGYSNQLDISKIDMKGHVTSKKTITFENSTTGYSYYFNISPDEKWVAMKEASSEWGYSAKDAKIQDIEIVSIASSNSHPTLIKITENGGAYGNNVSWSEDSRYLSFTDNDINGINQLYLFDTQTSKKEAISNFSSQHYISDIKWAPNNSILAASIFDKQVNDENYTVSNERIMLFSIQPQNEWTIEMKSCNGLSYWWGNNDLLLILCNPYQNNETTLFWYDVKKKNFKDKLVPYPKMNSEVYDVIPITEDLSRIALIGPKEYVYNLANDSFSLIDSTIPEETFRLGIYNFIESASGSIFLSGCY